MEEEGSWPRLGLLLLPGVGVGWLVIRLHVFLLHMSRISLVSHGMACLCRCGLLGGFIDQPTQGYNGNMPSRWVRIVGVRGAGWVPLGGLWFAGFP